MLKRLAAIDIGTNTFHLLIVDWDLDRQKFSEVFRKKYFVKLGAKSLTHIHIEAYQNGLKAMQNFHTFLKEYNCIEIKAFGTSAMRNADNAAQFQIDVEKLTGIKIDNISGEKEAALILKGVKLSYPFDQQPALIIDIGGGSVEFIIANKSKLHYAKSFKIGVAVLRNLFHQEEPIPSSQIKNLNTYLKKELKPLLDSLRILKPKTFIGASGTFDVIENILPRHPVSDSAVRLETAQLPSFITSVISKNLDERIALPEIPNTRADFIVVGLLLIEFVLQSSEFDQFIVTKHSMKEGILHEMTLL